MSINHIQNNFFILAILKLVQRQFFQYQKGRSKVVSVWQRILTRESSLESTCQNFPFFLGKKHLEFDQFVP